MLPVIGALVGAGDTVAVASGLAAAHLVERAGAEFVRVGHDSDVWFARLGAWARNTLGGVLRRVCDGWDTWICLRIKVMRACSR
jgi:hypothetical protein